MNFHPHHPVDINLARKILTNSCNGFLIPDSTGEFDFIIPTYDAILLSMYTNAFFGCDDASYIGFSKEFLAHPEPYYRERVGEININPLYMNQFPIFSSPLQKYIDILFPNSPIKYLILADSSNFYGDLRRLLEDILSKCEKSGIPIQQCLIWPSVERTYNRQAQYGYAEDFWEYIAAIELRKRGLMISKFNRGGDLSAFMLPKLFEKLVNSKLMNGGIFIQELEMGRDQHQSHSTKDGFDNNFTKNTNQIFCIEAESTQHNACFNRDHGTNQVKKYIRDSKGFYSGGFVSGPFIEEDNFAESNIGYITCTEEGNVKCSLPNFLPREANEDSCDYVTQYIKNTILTKMTFEERCSLIGISPHNVSLKEYFEKILHYPLDLVIERIKS